MLGRTACRRFVLVLLFMNLPAPSQPSAPSSSAPTASRAVVWWSRVLNGFLLGVCALLVALSYYNFTLYCENFGCMGKGLLWMLWAVFATVGCLVALVVRAWQRRRGLDTRASGLAFGMLSVMGAGHLLVWLGTTVLR
ncbi:MAG: hypothetical protein ACK41V_19840 [Acidovorax sp.]|uniref:hypothetical protein n=1 Tax=Acidovorax sp. TaxID=1872122 RepID=UPI00391D3532